MTSTTNPFSKLALLATVTSGVFASSALYAEEPANAETDDTSAPASTDVHSKFAMADASRTYDPFGIIKDGEMKKPEPTTVPTTDATAPTVEATPFQDLVEQHVRITALNAGRGEVYIGVRPYRVGSTVQVKTGKSPLRFKVVSISRSGVVVQDTKSDEQATISTRRATPGIRRSGQR